MIQKKQTGNLPTQNEEQTILAAFRPEKKLEGGTPLSGSSVGLYRPLEDSKPNLLDKEEIPQEKLELDGCMALTRML
jgi:hypothetical protein